MKKKTGPAHQQRMPIPSDWDEESWFCIQLQWPRSPQFIALLAGILSQPTRGWWWNEQTGQVTQAQAWGQEIYAKNIGFTPCGEECEDCSNGHYEIVYIPVGDCGEECEECEMGCTIPHGSIRINTDTGALQYFTCFGWVDVENWSGTVPSDPPPDDNEVDPVDGYSCNKAYGMASLYGQLFVGISAAVESKAKYYDKYAAIHAYMVGYDVSWKEAESLLRLYNATNGLALSAAQDPDLVAWLACVWEGSLDDTGDLSDDEWQRMKALLANHWTTVVVKYMTNVMDVIGQTRFKWWAQASYDETADCTCPDAGEGIIGPTASGWYLSEPTSFDIACPGGFSYGLASFYMQAPHDVYGCYFTFEHISGDPINSIKRANSCQLSPDVCFTTGNSDNFIVGREYCQMAAGAYAQISPLLTTPFQTALGTKQSDIIAMPTATAGQLVEQVLAGQAQGDPASNIIRFTLRWLYNTNGPNG